MAKKEPKLTPKQEMFCLEYLKDLNATQAAIRAGYSEKTSNEQGAQNLAKLSIQERIAELKKIRAEKLEISNEMVLKELANIGFSDIRKFYDENGKLKLPHELDDKDAAALSGLEVDELWGFNVQKDCKEIQGETKKIKLHDKLKALEMIAKHIGFFEKDNEQSKITIEQPISEIVIRKVNQ